MLGVSKIAVSVLMMLFLVAEPTGLSCGSWLPKGKSAPPDERPSAPSSQKKSTQPEWVIHKPMTAAPRTATLDPLLRPKTTTPRTMVLKLPPKVAPKPSPAPTPKSTPAPTTPPSGASPTVAKLLALHNAERAKAGAKPLRLNAKLCAAAQKFADYMTRTGKFSHTADGRRPSQRIAAEGYRFKAAGENIGYSSHGTAESVTQGWMNSPPHRGNILDRGYTEVGFGVSHPNWVTVFATPR